MLYRYVETLCLACGWRPGERTDDYIRRRSPQHSRLQPEHVSEYAWEQRMEGYSRITPGDVERLERKEKRDRWKYDDVDWGAVRLPRLGGLAYVEQRFALMSAM